MHSSISDSINYWDTFQYYTRYEPPQTRTDCQQNHWSLSNKRITITDTIINKILSEMAGMATTKLHVVTWDGYLYKRSPPNNTEDDWTNSAEKIGNREGQWALFHGPTGELYAVKTDGTFYKSDPPSDAQDTGWLARATKIGSGG